MKLLSRRTGLSLAIVICAIVLPAYAYYPKAYSYSRQIAKGAAAKWGNKATFFAVAAEDLRSDVFTIISACTTANGGTASKYECADAVTSAAMAFGLSVLTYHQIGTWSKRSTDLADQFLTQIPDSVKITDIQILGAALPSNSSSLSLHRRDDDAAPITVDYTGGLPLTFILHHPVPDTEHHIPLHIATDGSRMTITHLEALDFSNSTVSKRASKRSGIMSYSHRGTGGLKIEQNSDPVMPSYASVTSWLSASENDAGSPLYEMVVVEKLAPLIGVALVNKIKDNNGNAYDGQFIMEGETVPFSSSWETGWNWCFGPIPTNC